MGAVTLTFAGALDQAKETIGPGKFKQDDQNARTAAEIIDYGYPWLVDEPFQAVWDDLIENPEEGWWRGLMQQLLNTFNPYGETTDLDYETLFFTELERIREGMPALGSQGSQIPGDQWASPGRIVCSWPNLDITARAVLFVMAAHGNNKGENIWVSQQRIADYLGVHKRTAQRATERLAQAGAITKTAEPHQHRPTTYKLNRGSKVT